jgi:hypothetical protein
MPSVRLRPMSDPSESAASAVLRFAAYLVFALGLAATIAAGFAIAIDLAQFRYATI